MTQGKLEVVKQEMARVNVDILGINELKWTGMGEFNSDDHYIYYYGQEPLRRDGAKQKRHPVVCVTGDGSKVQCCKEQYCVGTWSIRSMNQGKLEVVKQEMARVNINI